MDKGYRLKKDNIEKVFKNQALREELFVDGWKEVEENTIDLKLMTVEQLKSLADEREIKYESKIKKDVLIRLLEDYK